MSDTPTPRRSALPDEFPLWRGVARYTAQGAILGAAAEHGARLLQSLVTPGIHAMNPHAVWMAPLANTLLLLPVTAAIAVVAGLSHRPRAGLGWLRACAYAFVVAQPLLLLGDRINRIAAVILAIGLGVQAARIVGNRSWGRHVHRLTAASAALIIAWAVLLPASRAVQYRRAVAGLADAPADRPNVLLLILDTVSAREMSLYGYHRRTTPILDSLARHGIVFDRAISSAPWTLPSHASMFSGRRADRLATRYLTPLHDRHVVAEEFADAGYVTAGFVGNLEYAGRASGLARGFHKYVDFVPTWSSVLVSSVLGRVVANGVSRWRGRPLQAGRKNAREVNREFLAWHDGTRGRPWFAFLNYYDAHDPYVPPRDDERRFLSAGQRPVYDVTELSATDTAAVASARAQHDAALFSLDREIGALLDTLRRRGDLERTAIVVTSDHGEEWGEQGVLLHGNSVYLPSLRVPLIVVFPGRVPQKRRVSSVVATRRLAATLLDLAGLRTTGVEGATLASTWSVDSAADDEVVSWVERAIRQPPNYPASRSALYSVITDSLQVILGADTSVYNVWSPSESIRRRPLRRWRKNDVLLALRAIRR